MLNVFQQSGILYIPGLNSGNYCQQEVPMKTNIGGLDRLARLIIGATLIGFAAFGIIGFWGYIGVVPIATALIGWCPVYRALGISTVCSADKCHCSDCQPASPK